ncbi:Predicted PurR-regulated permease PerM [Paenibacillus sp. UNCCL117]|uniref:AI-2E family transporter n=1 Tax=unclassified Paenibacillus TaxID=185978 RepID=UPI000890E9B9|nr:MULTISPECIES: AI-2E family transporter [unclassified Paenibacillus]SDC92115.1 Predicted PurR-regulated permease PerM [Paenibacillus sp. cl123]SFW29258.1 Predicted PurR-regulated permease PerM [Paenibacillus sp. UNCCL117]
MIQSRFLQVCLGIIAVLLIIFLTSKISFIFKPLFTTVNLLIVPFMLSGFFFYLLRPLVLFFEKQRMHKALSILLIYFVLAGSVVLFFILIWPTLQTQVQNFAESAPELIEDFGVQIDNLQKNRLISMLTPGQSDLSAKLSEYLNMLITAASDYVTRVVGVVTSFVIVVATVPIILYYMLKDGEHIPSSILHLIPRRYRRDGREVLLEIDSALSGFIIGRVIITGLLGVLLYIGYLIIGLPYSLLLALIATVLNIIPYIGPLLGAIPPLIVAFTVSPMMVFWVLVATLIAQQIEDNLLSPQIYGKRLDIHPLTTVILVLVAGGVAGLLGVILAIPAYMVVKIIFARIYNLFLADKVEELVE